LAVLIIFKYLGFLDGILHSLAGFIEFLPSFRIDKLIMPLGISYIVFKHISFLTDVKWGLVKPGRYGDFLLYSSLFTIFVAGPIERYERFRPQIDHEEVRFVWNDLDYGFGRIVLGMFKKLVFADWLGYFINPIWQNSHHYSAWIGLLALLGYSLQIYLTSLDTAISRSGPQDFLELELWRTSEIPILHLTLASFGADGISRFQIGSATIYFSLFPGLAPQESGLYSSFPLLPWLYAVFGMDLPGTLCFGEPGMESD